MGPTLDTDKQLQFHYIAETDDSERLFKHKDWLCVRDSE